MGDAFSLSHGIYSTTTGSARLTAASDAVITVINGPIESISKSGFTVPLQIDLHIHLTPRRRVYEEYLSLLFTRLLQRYVCLDMDTFCTLYVDISSTTTSLSLIGSSLLTACLDGGIPLLEPFYCVGDEELFVAGPDGKLALVHAMGPIPDEKMEELRERLEYVKEAVAHGIRDMYVFDGYG